MPEEKSLSSKIRSAITSVGVSITGAVGTLKDIQEMQIDYAVKEKTIELMNKLMEASTNQMNLQILLMEANNKIIELEQEKEKLISWDYDKLEYELFSTGAVGTVVYKFKPQDESKQPPHYLCVNCYNKRIKSILQQKPSLPTSSYVKMVCNNCKSEYCFTKEKLINSIKK